MRARLHSQGGALVLFTGLAGQGAEPEVMEELARGLVAAYSDGDGVVYVAGE